MVGWDWGGVGGAKVHGRSFMLFFVVVLGITITISVSVKAKAPRRSVMGRLLQ